MEDPQRFKQGRSIGSYVGLTPCRYQSGERDIMKSISRRGMPCCATISTRRRTTC
ncbi:transposase [uncultured Pleomorphomonas sp.]|uniref:transposase n=1 Tax=uncultured Pleomorphomonas sp. TaxID=442121 RepID=UPI00338EE16C